MKSQIILKDKKEILDVDYYYMDAFRCIRYFKNCKTYRETIKEGKLHNDT